MQIPSLNAQMAIFGIAGAAVSLYGASDPALSDRSRITTAGIAGVFGLASAMAGFKVWAAINGGIIAGTLGGIALSRMGADDAAQGAAKTLSQRTPGR